jgi:asparagine synthase (glutamine-hydrolysing)
MAVSLEARVPLLDHRIVEFSWTLPRRLKVRDGRGKWILRQDLKNHVPMALTDREKMGFSVPLPRWLAGPLRNWAGDLLMSESNNEFLNRGAVAREWDRFLAGDVQNATGLWALAMFKAWERAWLSPAAPAVGKFGAVTS